MSGLSARKAVGYRPTPLGLSAPRQRWSPEQERLVASSYLELGSVALAKATGRTAQAIEMKARKLGLTLRTNLWTANMDGLLRDEYATAAMPDLVAKLGKSRAAIHSRAKILKISRPRGVKPWRTEEYKREYVNRYAQRRFFYMRASKRFVGIDTARLAAGLWQIWKKQRGHCAITGLRLTRENARLDHINPSSRGGTDGLDNLRWVTCDANLLKSDRTDAELILICRQILATIGGLP